MKAYHLRAMHQQQRDMDSVVESWEDRDAKDIRGVFNNYLFSIALWASKEKGYDFKIKDIDFYKGTTEKSGYSFARRIAKAMPIYQIDQPFVEGEEFFGFVDHYFEMLEKVRNEIVNAESNGDIWLKGTGKGFENAKHIK